MPQLQFATFYGQISWLVITFLMVYFVSYFFLTPKISSNIESRRNIINSNLEQSDADAKSAAALRYELSEKIKASNEEAQNKQNAVALYLQNAIEKKGVEAERHYLDAIQKEDRKLELWHKQQVSEHLPAIIQNLKNDILSQLLGGNHTDRGKNDS